MTNELSVEDAIEVFEFMKREVLEGSKEDKVIDLAIKALKQQSFEGKTNGDVIRALFPNISIVNVFGGDIWFKVDNSHLICSESWWNSPYKESDKSETN